MMSDDAAATVHIQYADEIHLICEILALAGVGPEEAKLQAQILAEGDLRGHPSHGIRRLPVLVDRLRKGVSQPGRPARHTWSATGTLEVDGLGSLGPVAAYDAISQILERAEHSGIAMATVRNAGHIGMVAPYVERMAEAGFVGIALTVSEALVHPWGGATSMVGTNPIGIAVPTSGPPVVLDMSTAAVSAGKILDHAARGEAIPASWAIDAAGNPTTDAHAGAGGAISPFGGAKGYGLGLMFELMVGLLSGSAYGRDVVGTLDTALPPTKGDLFIAIRTDFADRAHRVTALERYLQEIRASGREGRSVQVPGDRSSSVRARHMVEGIPIDAKLWSQIVELKRTAALRETAATEGTA